MRKSLRKVIALVLSLIMIMSVAAVGFSVFAGDADTTESAEESTTEPAKDETTAPTDNKTDEPSDEDPTEPTEEPTTQHASGHVKTSFLQMFIDFWKDVYKFLKYIFYDVFRGDAPEPAPSIDYID